MLCKKCKEFTNEAEPFPFFPWDHCHHEDEKPKEKCWCEWPHFRRNEDEVSIRDNKGVNAQEWGIKFCPVCGKRMEGK